MQNFFRCVSIYSAEGECHCVSIYTALCEPTPFIPACGLLQPWMFPYEKYHFLPLIAFFPFYVFGTKPPHSVVFLFCFFLPHFSSYFNTTYSEKPSLVLCDQREANNAFFGGGVVEAALYYSRTCTKLLASFGA